MQHEMEQELFNRLQAAMLQAVGTVEQHLRDELRPGQQDEQEPDIPQVTVLTEDIQVLRDMGSSVKLDEVLKDETFLKFERLFTLLEKDHPEPGASIVPPLPENLGFTAFDYHMGEEANEMGKAALALLRLASRRDVISSKDVQVIAHHILRLEWIKMRDLTYGYTTASNGRTQSAAQLARMIDLYHLAEAAVDGTKSKMVSRALEKQKSSAGAGKKKKFNGGGRKWKEKDNNGSRDHDDHESSASHKKN